MRFAPAVLLLSFATLAGAQGAPAAPPAVAMQAAQGVAMGVDYHPGETVRYTFSLKANLTSRVNPRVPSQYVANFTPRQYEVAGEIIATFAPAQTGEPLHGTMQFKGLEVKNWASSANVADLEACLRQLEAAPAALTTGADGALQLAGVAASLVPNRFFLDAQDLHSLAQALLISRLSNQPLAMGQERRSEDFPIPGMAMVGIKITAVTEYLANIPIARHPNAEIRLTMNVPSQTRPLSSDPNAANEVERLHGSGVWTYLLDLDTHQISLLHKTIRTETAYSEESGDSNASVRIPRELFTVNKEFEATARRVAAEESSELEADLSAFGKSLQAPPSTASEASTTAAAPGSGGGESLGDIARRLRAGTSTPAPAPTGTTPGFRTETFPGGDMRLLVPAQASEVQRTSEVIRWLAEVGTPPTRVGISITELTLDTPGSPDEQLDKALQAVQAKAGVQVLKTEKKTINGQPASVSELHLDSPNALFQDLQAIVISRGKAFLTACGSLPSDFAKIESLCRTVVESTKTD